MNLAAMGGVWMYAGGGEGLSTVSLFFIAAFEKARELTRQRRDIRAFLVWTLGGAADGCDGARHGEVGVQIV